MRHRTRAGVFLVALSITSTLVAQENPPRSATPVEPADAAMRQVLADIDASMLPIPAGTFRMGDLTGRGMPDEKPVHPVTVAAFRMSKYEVTFQQFDAYTQATGKTRPSDQGLGRGTLPLINVSWIEAQEFLSWLNAQTGLKYRLPSEAEWEYAARAGVTTDYPWGASFESAKANGSGTSKADPFMYTAPVGSFAPNAWGLYDVVGNVWEWVQDCYIDSYDDASPTGEARTADVGDCNPVIRGGSWANDPANLRLSDRSWHAAQYRYPFLGFRLARDE